MKFTERRNLKRFALEVPAIVECTDSSTETAFHYLLTRDISGSGASFQTPTALGVNANVKVKIFLDIEKLAELPVGGHVLVVADGRVLRSDFEGVAVQFNEVCQVVPVC